MKQSLQLSETVLEGLTHVQKQLNETKYADAMQLMDDVIGGFASIENSASPVFADLKDTELVEAHIGKVRDSLERVVTSLEDHSYGIVQEILQFTLIPNVKKMKVEMEALFEPYLVS
ncbi:hypothetical protein ACM26V_13855 [Salipaludibacillus sp. HK11]|uniref:hypothetical protein n=1 Tax=Salipaludibacillus sp. HK11 TaxID=3394320 RepID=UPI0039FC7035